MAFPASTQVWDETMDPYDILDYEIDLAPLLEDSEAIASFSATVLTESDLYGLTIGIGAYAPTIDANSVLKLWLSINPANQADPVFLTGIVLPIEISIITNLVPPRRKQRTVAVKVIQK